MFIINNCVVIKRTLINVWQMCKVLTIYITILDRSSIAKSSMVANTLNTRHAIQATNLK